MSFRIEFNGSLLPGFDLQLVRMDVAVRLRLRDAQIERLFSGQTVVLKKAVSEASSQAYMAELRSMGLNARLVPLEDQEPAPRANAADFKVVFWGRILPGFDRTGVMAAAAKRLRVTPAQLMQMFSGAKVVLKRGVSAEQGARLVVDLALIGMQIELEMDQAASLAQQKGAVAQSPVAEAEDDPQYGALLRTACDLSGTAFSGYDVSSAVARDEMPVDVKPPVMPVRRSGEGYASANQDGYLNCPRCGVYQVHAAQCKKCGIELPQRKLRVGKQGIFGDVAPTTIVSPAEAKANSLTPQERRAAEPSLKEVMASQGERSMQESALQSRKPLWLFGALLLLLLIWLSLR